MADMINGKRLNMEIDFSANTQKARKEIAELQKQLEQAVKIASKTSVNEGLGITKEIQNASTAAATLQAHLEKAININTGKLDLGLLNKSFKDAGVNLEHYQKQLSQLGPVGNQAFNSLAQAILKADVPLKQTSNLLNQFATTLKNTARWQISSSILHGFMGSLQSAFGYAKNLNESLNNIRIVTGQSTDQMAKFATEANKAAQALSTTTTAYTDASLIYYQQGLSDEEVKRRTETTIKMANVSRQSAEEVSNQMTSVWNNFNKAGDQSTDHFADIMTALGAKTASSSSEIAEGLSKFAGIADTVGLSFDYAASALATITATSRESADVVGTSLKTIFSRLEGLKLGETLDDGTELNKYSEALEKIGVNIFDANNELKNMDTILEETGKKWQDLTQDQKMATAQTVAGVRQYNQFITLMDNWDFMQQNLQTSKDAEGTLQEQADIYAESWEAAEKRVRAAFEEIYSKILDDDFFIDLNNGFAGFLGIISNTIDALGGLEGVLSGIGVLITKIYGQEIAQTIDRFMYNFQDQSKIADSMKMQALSVFKGADLETQEIYSSLLGPQQAFMQNAEKLNDLEKMTVKILLEQQQAEVQNTLTLKQEIDLQKKNIEILKNKIGKQAGSQGGTSQRNQANAYLAQYQQIYDLSQKTQSKMEQAFDLFDAGKFNEVRSLFDPKDFQILQNALSEEEGSFKRLQLIWGETKDDLRTGLSEISNIFINETWTTKIINDLRELGVSNEILDSLVQDFNNLQTSTENFDNSLNHLKDSGKAAEESIKGLGTTVEQSLSQKIVSSTQAFMSFGMALSTITGLFDTWKGVSEGSVSGFDAIVSTMTSLGMVIPAIVSGVHALTAAFGSLTAAMGPIALIAAGIIAVGAIISTLTSNTSEAAKAAQKATDAAEGLKTQLEDTKKANEDLKKSLSDYTDARKALDDMVVGTQEWKDAVSNVNDKVLELINNYPELAKYIKEVNGILELSSQGQEELLTIQQKRIQDSQKYYLGGQINVEQSKENAFISDNLYREMDKVIDAYKIHGDIVLASVENLQEIANISEDSAKSIMEDMDEVRTTIQESIASREQSNLNTEQLISEIVKNNSDNLNQDSFSKFASLNFQSLLKDAMEANAESGSVTDKEAQEWYREQMGYKSVKDLDDDKGEYTKADGTTVTLDDSIAREAKATEAALKAFNNEIGNIKDKFLIASQAAQNLADGSENLSNKLILFFKNSLNLEELTEKEAQELKKIGEDFRDEEGKLDLGKINEDQQKFIENLGFDLNKSDDIHAISEIIGQLQSIPDQIDFSKFAKDLNVKAQEAYNKIIGENSELTGAGAKAIAEILQKAIYADGGQEIVDSFTGLFEQVDKDGKAKEFSNILSDLNKNWDIVDVDTFRKTLLDAGINVNYTDQQFQDLINSLQSSADAVEDFATKYKNIHEVIDSLSDGDIISDEDYQKLGEAANGYFIKMLDGTHKLIGSAKDFQDQVQKGLIEEARNQRAGLYNKNEKLYELKNTDRYDFDELSKVQGADSGGKGTGFGLAYDSSYVNEKNVQHQIDLVKALGDESEETKHKIIDWQEALNNHSINTDQLKALAEEVRNCQNAYESIDETIQENEEAMFETDLAIASTYDNFEDLNNALETGAIYSMKAYTKAAIELDKALDTDSLDPDEWEEYAKYLQKSAKELKGFNKEMSKEQSRIVAKGIMKMNDAIQTLSDNFKEWKKTLKETDKEEEKYADAMRNTKQAVADLLDVSEDAVTDKFVEKHLEDIEKAAKGDAEAIDGLRDSLINIAIKDIIDTNGLEENVKEFRNELDNITNAIPDLKIGADFESEEFNNKINDFIADNEMTVEQIQSLFDSLGYEPTFATEQQQITTTTPVLATYTEDAGTEMKTFTVTEPDGYTWQKTVPMVKTRQYTVEDGVVPTTQTMEVPAMSTKGTPKIKKITKKAGGSAASKPAPKKSSGGGGGGGGKSKTSAPKKDTTKKNYNDEFDRYWQINQNIDKVTHALSLLGKEQDYTFGPERVKNIDAQNKELKKQIKYIKDLQKEQKRERAELQGLNSKDRLDKNGNLIKGKRIKNRKIDDQGFIVNNKGKKVGASRRYGAKFDDEGYLANYKKITAKELDIWKDAQAKYNKERKKYEGNDKKLKKIEKEWEKAQNRYEKFKDWIDRYEKLTQDEIQSAIEEEKELIREMVENNILKWQTEIQFDIDTRDAERNWKKFLNKMKNLYSSTVSAFKPADLFVDTITESIQTINDKTKDILAKQKERDEYNWIATHWDEYAEKTPEEKRKASSASEAENIARGLTDEITQAGEEVAAAFSEGFSSYTGYLDEVQKDIDLLNSKFENQQDILNYNKELIELAYGEDAYDLLDQYYNTQNKVYESQVNSYKTQQEYWGNVLEKEKQISEMQGKTWDPDDMSTWSEAGVKAYQNMNAAAQNLRQTQLELIKNLKEGYLNTLNKIVDTYTKSLTGGKSLDDVSTQWERAKSNLEHYLDTTEKTYHIQSLISKIDKSIDSMKDVKASQKLNKLRETELKYLSEKKKLTQYDIDAANARYEIALKEIALEEAQNNKNSMKLTRNAEGNWTYQYVADQNDIEAKQQELSDANYNYYKMAKEHYISSLDDINSLQQSYRDQLLEIMSDTTLTEQEQMDKRNALEKWYYDEYGRLAEENSLYQQDMSVTATKELQIQYDTDKIAFEKLNNDKIDIINNLKEKGTKDFYDLFDSFNGYAYQSGETLVSALVRGDEAAFPEVDSSMKELVQNANKYLLTNDDSLQNAFISSAQTIVDTWNKDDGTGVKQQVSSSIKVIDDKAVELRNNIAKYTGTDGNSITNSFKNVKTEIGNAEKAMITFCENSINEVQKLIDKLNELFAAQQKADSNIESNANTEVNPISSSGTMSTNYAYKYKNSNQLIENSAGETVAVGTIENVGEYAIEGTKKGKYKVVDMTDGSTIGTYNTFEEAKKSAKKLWNNTTSSWGSSAVNSANQSAGEYLSRTKIGFATGGYTGSWDGNDGRLAVLHQKELVLNANDTKNMLDAVDTIRDITSLNSSITNSIAKSISGIVAGTTQHMLNGGNITQDIGSGEQYVIENINAEFPNAQNVDDIREAIMSLPRLASQYVSRNLK